MGGTHRSLGFHGVSQCIKMQTPSFCLPTFRIQDGWYVASAQSLPAFQPEYSLDRLPQYTDVPLPPRIFDASRWECERSKARHTVKRCRDHLQNGIRSGSELGVRGQCIVRWQGNECQNWVRAQQETMLTRHAIRRACGML